MSSYAHIASRMQLPEFGDAWRDSDGNATATVRLGLSHLAFGSVTDARACAAACLQAADAMEALPPPEVTA